MLEFPRHEMMIHSITQKNGSITIRILGSKERDSFNSAYCITNHLLHFYKESVLAPCEAQRIAICKPMTATRYAAMKAEKIKGMGKREVQKYLSAELGHGFCPSQQSFDILSDGHAETKYNSMNFTFNGKQEENFIEWTEKDIANAIAWNLLYQLPSKNIHPSRVQHVEVVAGGYHGDVAFQFRAAILINILTDGSTFDFEVAVSELICRKDTAKLIEAIILPGLTFGFKKVATLPLHIHYDNHNGNIYWEFSETSTILSQQHLMTIERVDCYVTGDLAFQAMSMGWIAIDVCCVGPTNLSSWMTIHYCRWWICVG